MVKGLKKTGICSECGGKIKAQLSFTDSLKLKLHANGLYGAGKCSSGTEFVVELNWFLTEFKLFAVLACAIIAFAYEDYCFSVR